MKMYGNESRHVSVEDAHRVRKKKKGLSTRGYCTAAPTASSSNRQIVFDKSGDKYCYRLCGFCVNPRAKNKEYFYLFSSV